MNFTSLVKWLKSDDINSVAHRAGRLKELLSVTKGIDSEIAFIGGELSLYAFEELRRCYVHSSDIRAICLLMESETRPNSLFCRIFADTKRRRLAAKCSSVVLLSLSFIEREISARHSILTNSSEGQLPLCKLLDDALNMNIIKLEQYVEINRIRKLRNSYAHFRPPLHKDGLIIRTVEAEASTLQIVKDDALAALKLVFDFIEKDRFF